MRLTDLLIDEAERTYRLTEDLFRRIDESELSWKPASGKNWMSVGQLMMHCASYGCGKAVRGFVTGVWAFPAGSASEGPEMDLHLPPAEELSAVTSVREALALLEEDRKLAINSIARAGDSALLETSTVAPWGGTKSSLFQHLLHMISHLAQHKGQLYYYLKLMGKEVSTPDLWGNDA